MEDQSRVAGVVEIKPPVENEKNLMLPLDSELNHSAHDNPEHEAPNLPLEQDQVQEERGSPQADGAVSATAAEQESNLKLVIWIRLLVLIQPIVGMGGISFASLLMYFIAQNALFFYLSLIVPVFLLVFAFVEIRIVTSYIKEDRWLAFFYNVINKGFYVAELLFLAFIQSDPSSSMWFSIGIGTTILHLLFFFCSSLYKKKREIEQYVARN